MAVKKIVLILHSIRSIYNVASIFRTADAAGVSKIYLTGVTPGPLDRFRNVLPQFRKVSLGAEKTVPFEKVSLAATAIRKLKKEDYAIFAVEQAKNSMPYFSQKIKKYKKTAMILGNEVRGLPSSVLKSADAVLEIPMAGKKESLNVSVAAGIVLFGLIY